MILKTETTKKLSAGVSEHHHELMEMSLVNDEASSNEELYELFTSQGVSSEHARRYVDQRNYFLCGYLTDTMKMHFGSDYKKTSRTAALK